MFSKLKNNLITILTGLVYISTFTGLIFSYTDKDWGWHYKYGEYFWTHGQILAKDIFTWTMEGYPWINHEWSFDPILYFLFKNTGYLGMSIAGAIVAIFCFWLLTHRSHWTYMTYWKLAIAGFFFAKLMETGINEGLRAQVLAFIPLAILMYLLEKAKNNSKILYFLPLLFLIWTNMHGTVVFGLAIMGAFLLWYFLRFKEHRKLYLVIGTISILVTTFNPFGIGIYHEVIKHTTNPYLHNVTEWLPITQNCPDCNVPTFTIYVLILIIAIVVRRNLEDVPYAIIIAALLWQTIGARRYIPLFGISTFPLFLKYLNEKSIDFSKYKIIPYLTIILALIAVEYNLFSRLPNYNFYHYNEYNYCKYSSGCSPKFMEFIKDHPPVGNGFNFYDWGGYLIGKSFPGKLFIDGRMHLWETSDGTYTPFGDMIKMYYNGDQKLFDSYNFDWVLIPLNSEMAKNISTTSLMSWKIGYQDETTIYFVRNK